MPKKSTPDGSSKKEPAAKKPSKDFPLTPHPTGRWCKRVKGKLFYFGRVAGDENGEVALIEWLRVKDDLLAGRAPRPKAEGISLADLCNHFLTAKQAKVDSGELSQRTFVRYKANTDILIATFGKNRVVLDLSPQDFERLRQKMAKRFGPVALGNEIQMTRSVFRYGCEAELVDRMVRFGPEFKKPSQKTLRMARAEKGKRDFEPEDIHALLSHTTVNMRAMILLGLQAGMGNTDLGEMSIKVTDLKRGWLDYPRAKTGVERRIPLWPETIAALRDVLASRRQPADSSYGHLLFIGLKGENYVGNHKGYRVTQEFDRVAEKAKVENHSFYDLRRTFQTVGEETGDLVAVSHIMGHAPRAGDMASIYRQRVSDERLRAVVDRIHKWLYGDAQKPTTPSTTSTTDAQAGEDRTD